MSRFGSKLGTPCMILISLLLTATVAAGVDKQIGPKLKIKGVVIEVSGDLLLVEQLSGDSTQVQMVSSTEVEEKKNNFLRGALPYSQDDIIPGLKVVVEGRVDSDGKVWANEVKFTQDDLKVAQVLDTRMAPVERRLDQLHETSGRLSGQIDELNEVNRETRSELRRVGETANEALNEADRAHQRIASTDRRVDHMESRWADLDNYDVRSEASVFFAAGKTELSEEGKVELDRLVALVTDTPGALIEVTGYASSDGNEAFNRRLSQRRADSVLRYLTEHHQIPLRHFLNPHGFGELLPVADNATLEGRQQNRRAVVRLLVNKGLGQDGSKMAGLPN